MLPAERITTMSFNQKGKEPMWNESNAPKNFDLHSTLEESSAGKKVISKYFSGVWDIFKLNDICRSYLIRKNKETAKPIADNIHDCLNKIADVFVVLQETTYPLYLLKMNLNKAALDADGLLAENLEKTANWLNTKIYGLENTQLDNETLEVCTNIVRETAKEISEKAKRGDSAPSFAEKRLIVDIAELYQNIHGEWPLRELKVSGSAGPLDEIMTILGGVLGCGTLTLLIGDFDNDLRKRLEKEKARTKTREKRKGSKNLIAG
jgi:hypothetical protein